MGVCAGERSNHRRRSAERVTYEKWFLPSGPQLSDAKIAVPPHLPQLVYDCPSDPRFHSLQPLLSTLA